MVKQLGVKNDSHSQQLGRCKPRHWKALVQNLLAILALAVVNEYLWSTKGTIRVNVSAIADQYRQYNRVASAVFADDAAKNATRSNPSVERHLDSNLTKSLRHEQQQEGEEISIVAQADEGAAPNLTLIAEPVTSPINNDPQTPPPNDAIIPIQNMSVIHYNGCCGLGHRLTRQFGAYYASRKLGFKLNVNWPGCGLRINMFDELFFPETQADLVYVTATHEFYKIGNEVAGFFNAEHPENCVQEEIQSGYEMYSSLKRRFKLKPDIDSFIQQHFDGHFAIGIHIRAGNGEVGDFTNKARQVPVKPQTYVRIVSKQIVDLIHNLNSSNNTQLPPPVLFVATDTAQYVQLFQTELQGIMPVVEWNQNHEVEGEGVFAGQWQKRLPKEECIQKWAEMISDMILLSSTNLLIAGQYSSFTQAMPVSLIFGGGEDDDNNNNNNTNNPNSTTIPGVQYKRFCEVNKEYLDLRCYSSQMDWCKNTPQTRLTTSLGENGKRWPFFLKTMYSSHRYHKREGRL